MGMPDEEQMTGRAKVMDCLMAKVKQGPFYSTPGFPLIIYPKLDDQWHHFEKFINEVV